MGAAAAHWNTRMLSRVVYSSALRLAALFGLALLSVSTLRAGEGPSPVRNARVAFARRPLAFEAIEGQPDRCVRFVSRGSGYSLFLSGPEAVLALGTAKPRVLRMALEGANAKPKGAGEARLPGETHYLRGSDPRRWRKNVPSYARARFAGVYPGVDLVYYGRQGQLEYDFQVAPKADPSRIRMRFEGAERAEVGRNGELLLTVGGHTVRQERPRAYQTNGCCREPAPCRFVRLASREGGATVGFRVAGYDPARELIIDPVLAYSTYLGGSGNDSALGVAVDGAGSIYVAGSTVSTDFPTAAAMQGGPGGGTVRGDAFVAKLTPSGDGLVYSTYLGGSGSDSALGLKVDGAGSVYLAGRTDSTDFPVVGGFQTANRGGDSDGFVARLNATGSALAYSTYLGGRGTDFCTAIAIDGSHNAYVTGYTTSDDFPVARAVQPVPGGPIVSGEAFIARVNADGASLAYSTYLGGTAADIGQAIAAGDTGSVYVAGFTASNNFPVTGGAVDRDYGPTPGTTEGFVTHLDASGLTVLYSTYLGGSANDAVYGLAIDADGYAYLTGETASADFPLAFPLQAAYGGGATDAFAAKLAPDGAGLAYSTYLGGSGTDTGRGIAADGGGSAYLTGGTFSTNFPLANPLRPHAGSFDAFVAKLNGDGSALRFSTCLGGVSRDVGQAVALGAVGSVYVAGTTVSPDFPLAAPLQTEAHGNGDAFVATISEGVAPPAVPTSLHTVAACTSRVTLGWTDNSDNEDSFEIERKEGGITAPAPYLPVGAVEANVTTFADSGLSAGSTYTYRVRAVNGDGPSPYSNELVVTTLISLPAAPTDLTASAPTATSVALAWQDNSGDETGFAVERSTDGAAFTPAGAVGANVTGFTDSSVEPNTSYFYRVRANIGGCESAPSNSAGVTTPVRPLNAPSDLTARPVSDTEIDLAWTDHSDNETGFRIERKTGTADFAEVIVTDAGATTYADKNLLPNTKYVYRIRATNADSSSAYTSEAQATTFVQPFGILRVPKSVNFGKVIIGRGPVTRTLRVKNASRNETMRVTVGNPTAPYTLVSGGGTAYLIVGGARDVVLRLAANKKGKITGSITISSTAHKKAAVTVKLTAVGK